MTQSEDNSDSKSADAPVVVRCILCGWRSDSTGFEDGGNQERCPRCYGALVLNADLHGYESKMLDEISFEREQILRHQNAVSAHQSRRRELGDALDAWRSLRSMRKP